MEKKKRRIFPGDLTGMRFGRLVAVDLERYTEDNLQMWRCRCDCGNEHIVLRNSLLQGATKSCGCIRQEKSRVRIKEAREKARVEKPCEPGMRFGRWTVLEKRPCTRPGDWYLCRCDCGTEGIRERYNLVSGRTNSCGCIRKEKVLEALKKRYGQI